MLEKKIRAKVGVLAAKVGDELVLLDALQEKYFCIRGAGVDVWGWLSDWTDEQALGFMLCNQFGIELDVGQRDVLEFLGALRNVGLIEEN